MRLASGLPCALLFRRDIALHDPGISCRWNAAACPSPGGITGHYSGSDFRHPPLFRHRQCYGRPMTLSDKIERTPAPAAPGSHLAAELAETLKLAAPMALTQLGQIAMMTTDLAFIGRLGDAAVGAAALAGTVYFVAFTVGMGLVSAVAPLAAQAFGARDPRMVRRSVRSGLWAGFLISLPIMVFPLRGEQILQALGQAAEPAHLAQQYLFGLVWGVAPALWFIAIRSFMGAVNRPRAGAVDHAGRDPRQRAAGLSPDLWRVRAAAARPVRRRACHGDGQWRQLPRGALDRHAAPAVPRLSHPGPALAHRLGPDAPARRDRRADLDRVHAGIRACSLPPRC